MPTVRRMWRSACMGGCAWLLASCSFDGKTATRERSKPARPALAPPVSDASLEIAERARDAPGSVPAAAASVIAQTLRDVHDEKLDITPPQVQSARLAFGPGRLLQAGPNQVIVRDTKLGDALGQAAIDRVLATAHGADGALFALGLSGGVRFEPHSSTAHGFGHVAFLPGSSLFPDLEAPRNFYVHYPAQGQLYRYSFDGEAGAFLAIDTQYALPGCTTEPTLLRDGAFACRSAHGILRKAARGVKSEFTLPKGMPEPLRLLPAKRLDEVFVVSRSGEVAHLRLEQGTPLLGHFSLPAPVFSAVGNGEALAFVLVTPPEPGRPRRWQLAVTDFEGTPRLTTDLAEANAAPGEDWLEAVTEDKDLAISEFEPLVSVSGARQIAIWNYLEGKRVFAR